MRKVKLKDSVRRRLHNFGIDASNTLIMLAIIASILIIYFVLRQDHGAAILAKIREVLHG